MLFAPPRVASPWMPFWRPPEGPHANLKQFWAGSAARALPLKASALVRRGLRPGPRAVRGPDLREGWLKPPTPQENKFKVWGLVDWVGWWRAFAGGQGLPHKSCRGTPPYPPPLPPRFGGKEGKREVFTSRNPSNKPPHSPNLKP